MSCKPVRLVSICDPHLSPANPAAWKSSYEDFNTGVLRQLWAYAGKIEAEAILIAGDVFHRKRERDLAFVVRTARLLKEAPCPVYAIAGNHDMTTGSIGNGLTGTAFEALVEMGAVKFLDRWHFSVQRETFTVACSGASYAHSKADSFIDLNYAVPFPSAGPVWKVGVGHFGFGPTDGDLFGERIYSPDSLDGGEHNVAVIGHHHYDQGILESRGGKLYVAAGSSTWTSKHKADVGRRPAAAVIEITAEGCTAKVIRPKVPPVEDVIDTTVQEQVTQEDAAVEAFVEQLGSMEFAADDPDALLAATTDLSEDVRERVKGYLERAEAEL